VSSANSEDHLTNLRLSDRSSPYDRSGAGISVHHDPPGRSLRRDLHCRESRHQDGRLPSFASETARDEGAKIARSVCPYCAVGCGQLVFHKDGKLVSIEGDPESPISRGRLCPKGADSFELLTHSKRLTKVKYRRPYSKEWEDLELDKAMEMIADRVWESRGRTFVESKEENYLIKKLFTAGLGMVCVSNQARI
jgi:formate dehydrogenase major subunit